MLKWTGKPENFLDVSLQDQEAELELLFGPFEPGEKEAIVWIDDSWNVEKIAVNLGKFPSLSQARKNGWSGPVPKGFKEWKIGKSRFWTWGGYVEQV